MARSYSPRKAGVKVPARAVARVSGPPMTDDDRLARGAKQLERLMEAVDVAIDRGDCTPALLAQAAAVQRTSIHLSAERRAIEKHDRALAKTPEQRFRLLMAYVQELDVERRAELAQAIARSGTNGKSVLS